MGQTKTVRHVPMRTCVACRQSRPKRELVRVVCLGDGKIEIDTSGKKPGRGAYLCYAPECWDKGLKKGRIEYALRGRLDDCSRADLEEFSLSLRAEDGDDDIG